MKFFACLKGNMKEGFLYVCDEDIKGKKLSEGKKQIDLENSYYDWKELDEREIVNMIKGVSAVTFFGINSVSIAQKLRLLELENAIFVCGVPYCSVILK